MTHDADMVLGIVLTGLGRPQEAEVTFRRLLESPVVADDEDTKHLVQSHLAAALAAQDQRQEAAALWRESVPGLWPGEANTLLIADEAIAALENWHDAETAGGYGEIAARLRAFVAQLEAGP